MGKRLAQVPDQESKTEHPKDGQKPIDSRTQSGLKCPSVVENRRDEISDDRQ